MPPPFRSLEARPIDSVSSIFNVSITTTIPPLASTTVSNLAQLLTASSTPVSITTLSRPRGIFSHNYTSPNSTAPETIAYDQRNLDMGKLKLIAAILGALVSIIGLVRLLIWAPLHHCIPKKWLPKADITLERTEPQRDTNYVLKDKTRRRRWYFRKGLGGDGATDDPTPDATRSSGMGGGLVELFSLPVITTVFPSATATLSNFGQLLSGTGKPTNLTLDGRPADIFNHNDTSPHSKVAAAVKNGVFDDLTSRVVFGLLIAGAFVCFVWGLYLCISSRTDDRRKRQRTRVSGNNLANMRVSILLPSFPGFDGTLDNMGNGIASPRNQIMHFNEARGVDLESGLGDQNINTFPPPPYARGVVSRATAPITTPTIVTQQDARQAFPFCSEQSVFPPLVQNAAQRVLGNGINHRIPGTSPPRAPSIMSKIPTWFFKRKSSCLSGRERDHALNDLQPQHQIPDNFSSAVLTASTEPASNTNQRHPPSDNNIITNKPTESAADRFSEDVLRSCATAFSPSNRLPTIAESASPTAAPTGAAPSPAQSGSSDSTLVPTLGIQSVTRNSNSSVSVSVSVLSSPNSALVEV